MRDLLTRLHGLPGALSAGEAGAAALHDVLAEMTAQLLGMRAVLAALAAGETVDEDNVREWVYAVAGTAEAAAERVGAAGTVEQRAETIALEVRHTLPSNN